MPTAPACISLTWMCPKAACCCLRKELAWPERGQRPEVQVELEQQQAQPGRMLLVLLMEQALMVWAQLESALPDSVSSGW